MIAPRPLAIVAGEKDRIFPIDGVKDSYEKAKEIYSYLGAEENCSLHVTPKGHWWCEDIIWQVVQEETKKLGWWQE